MENLSRNMEKEIKNKSVVGKKSQWQILFVDDRGKMITIKWFKPLSAAVLSALLISVILCIVLIFLFQSTRKNSQGLLGEIDKYRNRIESIRTEKDILMTKLVIAESKINDVIEEERVKKENKKEEELQKTILPLNQTKKNKAKAEQKEKIIRTDKNKDKIKKDKVNSDKVSNAKVKNDKVKNGKADNNKTNDEIINGVEIENFIFSHESGTDLLRARFVIKNTSKVSDTISGYIFVILKPDEKEQTNWFTIPSAGLISGKPAFPKEGQYFKIHRFKTVHFKASNQKNPELYKKVTIFIFNEDSGLLLRKTFPVKIESA